MNYVEIKISLKVGGTLQGKINIRHYTRFSDYIDSISGGHLKVIDTIKNGQVDEFTIVPTSNVAYYQPTKE